MTTFAIGEHDFLLDGQPYRILSGALHYFRIHPDQWADRIHQARLMGLNTIETYLPWNAHEPVRGQWSWQGGSGPWSGSFEGGLDLAAFLETVAAEGMHAIVRPGPYICAEWNNGGLPGWLFADGRAGVRHDEPVFMAEVERYLRRVGEVIAPHQIDRGGPVILVQVENEYGSFSADPSYLSKLVQITRDAGITVPLTSVDGAEDDMQANGSVPGLHRTASFGSRSLEAMETLRRHQPTGPLMAMEYWNGWFDHWGVPHHATDAAAAAADLDDLLSTGASVNLYMFCGGTNFALGNGANWDDGYRPTVTSYDYNAPLDEAGRPGAKYWAFREVIGRYAEEPQPAAEPPHGQSPTAPALTDRFSQETDLIESVEATADWAVPDQLPTMDQMGQFRGFALYRTRVGLEAPAELSFAEVRDRAVVFAGGVPIGVLSRQDEVTSVTLPAGHYDLALLVEDQGRINYAARIGEPKGLIGPALLRPAETGESGETAESGDEPAVDTDSPLGTPPVSEGLDDAGRSDDPTATEPVELTGWRYLPVPPNLSRLASTRPAHHGRPVLRRGTLSCPTSQDLFLDTEGWGKGLVWFNGVCLGRFWDRGPQRTLYVPAPLVRAAGPEGADPEAPVNEIVVMDLHPRPGATIATLLAPILDSPIRP
ncbi:beta-galactosidase [Acidipropionibacterium thoenii]|uniref:beta-galactosidase n=1 Tax=Acidipropionibacterium thoenii TaxID=1751 RepID=UPI000410F563|nr:beta-galactosidase [Acidipropionibacterium thoenii]